MAKEKVKSNKIVIKSLPTLLNSLYIPVIKISNGKPIPGIVKSKEAKEWGKLVHLEALRQKTKILSGKISFKCDILNKDRKDFDIDAIFKLTFDSLEGFAYKNDKQIVEVIARKHLNAEYNGLHIYIEEVEE